MSLGIINPKKRREIEGVSNQSMVDLKAAMFGAEAEAKRAKASGTSGSATRLVVKPVAKNKGVEERMLRDRIEVEKRLDPSECLGAKMEQYHAMSGTGFRDEREKYLVDFEQKKWSEGGSVHRGAELPDGEVLPANVLQANRHQGHIPPAVQQMERTHNRHKSPYFSVPENVLLMKGRQDDMKKRRLEAARKRMQAKANAK